MTTHKLAAMTGAVALSIAAAAAHAENPFELNTLSQGYQVADATDSKAKEGKCSSGKCGASSKQMKHGNTSATKAKEGSCHHDHDKAKEGACSADKMKEGSCSAEKMKEGSCHASK
jgi:uncharacterized low-complexity protein